MQSTIKAFKLFKTVYKCIWQIAVYFIFYFWIFSSPTCILRRTKVRLLWYPWRPSAVAAWMLAITQKPIVLRYSNETWYTCCKLQCICIVRGITLDLIIIELCPFLTWKKNRLSSTFALRRSCYSSLLPENCSKFSV